MADYTDLVGEKIFKGIATGDGVTYFKLDDKIHALVEDEDDGYRSYGRYEGEITQEEFNKLDLQFNLEHTPIAVDILAFDKEFKGINIHGAASLDSYCDDPICILGTDYSDDWYPCCISHYDSKEATKVLRKQSDFIAEKLLLNK